MAARLTRQLVIGLCGLWLAAVGAAGLAVQSELDEVFDSILAETAQQMLHDILLRHGERLAALGPDDQPLVPATAGHEEYITYHLTAADGRVLMRSHAAAPVVLLAPLPPGPDRSGGTRAHVEASADGRYRFRLAEPPDHRGHTIRGTLLQLMLPMAVLIVATLLLVPVAVRRSLRPVARLQAEIGRRGGHSMDPIPAIGLPDELRPIREDVNLLLRRTAQAMEAERRFAANAAHELRTPLAAAMAQSQLLGALLPRDHAGAAPAMAMTEELRRLARRVEKLLQLGRAEAGVALRPVPTDLMVPLQLLVEEYARQRPVALDAGGLCSLIVRADMDMAATALRNLIENATLHGDRDGAVVVRLAPDGTVSVANGAAIMAPDRLARLGTPFVRGGSARGSGLGLAIVRMIAEQTGGALTLHSPARGQSDGFEAVLRLPLWPGRPDAAPPSGKAAPAGDTVRARTPSP